MELGMPLDLLTWFEADDRNYGYAPIDEDTRNTLRDMQKMKHLAYKEEDYEALKVLAKDEKEVFDLGQQIWRIKNQIEIVVAQEKFEDAIELRKRLKELENKRRVYDALYETENYEKMIEMPPPNEREMLEMEREWEEERRREADRFRRQMEMEEAERRRILEEEKERLRLLEEEERRLREATNQKPSVSSRKFQGKKLHIIDEENDKTNLSDPLKFNEGDVDLQSYLKPLLSKIGINWERLEEIAPELSKRLWSQGYLQIFGAKLWMAINSENWRMREAAAQAVLNFIEMPLPKKYLDGKSLKLFLAALEVSKIACEDKILQIYFIGLKILSTALAPPVCGSDVSPKQINQSLKEFLPILITKISELNYRARDISMHTLISLFKHPAAQVALLIQAILKDCILDPSFEMLFVPVDKQQPRIIQAKIEILLQVLQEFGYDERQWDWLDVFQYLIVPSLFHGNADVRQLTIELIAQLYQLIGEDIRNAVTEIENLKPNLLDSIIERLDQMQQLIQQQGGFKGLQKQLPAVKEENEEIQIDQNLKKSQLNNKSQKFQPSPKQSQIINNSSQLQKSQLSNKQIKQNLANSNNEFLQQIEAHQGIPEIELQLKQTLEQCVTNVLALEQLELIEQQPDQGNKKPSIVDQKKLLEKQAVNLEKIRKQSGPQSLSLVPQEIPIAEQFFNLANQFYKDPNKSKCKIAMELYKKSNQYYQNVIKTLEGTYGNSNEEIISLAQIINGSLQSAQQQCQSKLTSK